MADIHWYPGHMTKAIRTMREDIKLIDVIIELIDARIPVSSRNPDIEKLAMGKARVIALNKADLADDLSTEAWIDFFKEQSFLSVKLDSKSGQGIKKIKDVIHKAAKEKFERDKKRGIINRPVRTMIVGIPNVGKSTFVNSIAGRTVAKAGNKPGVTKGKQWIRLDKKIELLDTPGILWPKFENRSIAEHLAYIGTIKDEIIQKVELSISLIEELKIDYKNILENYYKLECIEENMGYGISFLKLLSEKRGFLKKGGILDIDKASMLVLDDFKNGRIGRITLEKQGYQYGR